VPWARRTQGHAQLELFFWSNLQVESLGLRRGHCRQPDDSPQFSCAGSEHRGHSLAGEAQRTQGVVKKEKGGRQWQKLAVRCGRDQQANREIVEPLKGGPQQTKQKKAFAPTLAIGRIRLVAPASLGRAVKPGIDRSIEEPGTSRKADAQRLFPAQAFGFALDSWPIDASAGTQPIQVDQPFERSVSVPRRVHRKIEKLPIRAQCESGNPTNSSAVSLRPHFFEQEAFQRSSPDQAAMQLTVYVRLASSGKNSQSLP